MDHSLSTHGNPSKFALNSRKSSFILSGVFLSVAGLTIFQDFLASQRSGYGFYFGESLLFKTVWLVFVPILTVLYGIMKKKGLHGVARIATLIVSSIVAHLLVVTLLATVLSAFFFGDRYGPFKIFSYTMVHDFHLLAIGYTAFVLGYRFFSNRTMGSAIAKTQPSSGTIVINNGKDNVIVDVRDIVYIASATPYVSIHLAHMGYLHSDTLRSICERLDGEVFVRIHKSTVVNISKVVSFKSRLNGDYDLQLNNGNSLRLSRTYAAGFKKRFQTSHRVSL